ncbi:MAG: translation elongation factor Ts [Bacteroidetes bacterium GWE2_39_28]|nr:MAG: translation elongation factor Ts [Bacteroidetes bacterium GWE2_39_28]OFY14806.1 MAG: translation elongation factor Ts [Bacteroidetes bacterium GWF2_39_10]OFZ12090.1 MAG: translation elongation factor Ts [Bacteroidetes bacterium RIFOXYC2_FULL_39_11]HCT93267.1 elongation factor Ts [Rikenellaceae bacterium]HCV16260.1 elongation factor Ts [Rikenellaceae bacterium]
MEIKATDVAKLRQMTGAGMMDCKSALVEASGDFDKAKDIIREKGKLVAAKRADRETTEGSVIALATENNNKAIVVCLGCETDFVAKNSEFQALANKIAETALTSFPSDLEALKATMIDGQTIEEAVTQQTGKSGEKHAIPFYAKLEAPYIATYIHTNGKLATIVGFSKEISKEVGREIAMQITAMNPVSVSKDSCPQSVIEKELEIYRIQIREEGKPENMVEQIAQGKLAKFFKESTLEDQTFVKDGKITVAQYLKTVDPEVKVTGFFRFSLND